MSTSLRVASLPTANNTAPTGTMTTAAAITNLLLNAALLMKWDKLNPSPAAVTKKRIAAMIPMNGRGDTRSADAPTREPTVMNIASGEIKNEPTLIQSNELVVSGNLIRFLG